MSGGGGRRQLCMCLPRKQHRRFLLFIGMVFIVVCALTFSKRKNMSTDTKPRHGGAVDDLSEESAGIILDSALDQWLSRRRDLVVPHRDSAVVPNGEKPRMRNEKVHILIIASQRSGSSFLGELFKQNQNFFYAFEPIRPLTFSVLHGELDNKLFDKEAISRLHDFLTCRNVVVYRRTARGTSGRKSIDLSPQCRSKTHVALKEIRFYNIETLRTVAEDPALNLKIIHLVRDPRAVMNSRKQSFFSNHDFKRKRVPWDEVTDLCKDMKHNIDVVSELPRWLRGKYILVRYEDLALRPMEAAVDIYNFVGLPMDPHVLEWVKANTHQERGGDLSTSRNSSERVTAWRKEMTFFEIADIQRKCQGPMKMLGYNWLQNEITQHEMSFPVFKNETKYFKFPYVL